MPKLHALTAIIVIIAASHILFGCGNDDSKYPDDIYTNFRYDIVTYNGLCGNSPCFTYVPRSDDSAQVVLKVQNSLGTGSLNAGTRVLLRYSPLQGAGFAAGDTLPVNAFFYNAIISDSLRAYKNQVPVSSFVKRPVKVRSVWRTGDYINLHCQVEYTGKPRVFMLVLDPSSAHADTVHCHLVHDLRTDTAYFWRNCYASFHVGKIWRQSSCHTLRVHISNAANSQENCFDFSK